MRDTKNIDLFAPGTEIWGYAWSFTDPEAVIAWFSAYGCFRTQYSKFCPYLQIKFKIAWTDWSLWPRVFGLLATKVPSIRHVSVEMYGWVDAQFGPAGPTPPEGNRSRVENMLLGLSELNMGDFHIAVREESGQESTISGLWNRRVRGRVLCDLYTRRRTGVTVPRGPGDITGIGAVTHGYSFEEDEEEDEWLSCGL